jgi:hypothetical protein
VAERTVDTTASRPRRSRPPRQWPTPTRPLRVLALGAGVQSSSLLLLSLAGELPRLDGAVFASQAPLGQVDLGGPAERAAVDRWGNEWEGVCAT